MYRGLEEYLGRCLVEIESATGERGEDLTAAYARLARAAHVAGPLGSVLDREVDELIDREVRAEYEAMRELLGQDVVGVSRTVSALERLHDLALTLDAMLEVGVISAGEVESFLRDCADPATRPARAQKGMSLRRPVGPRELAAGVRQRCLAVLDRYSPKPGEDNDGARIARHLKDAGMITREDFDEISDRLYPPPPGQDSV